MPKEKNSACSAISSATSAARGTSIMVPTVIVELDRPARRTPVWPLAAVCSRRFASSSRCPTSGIMISGLSAAARLHPDAGAASRIARDLHLVDLGIGDPEAAAAVAEHRVELVQRRSMRGSSSPAGIAHRVGRARRAPSRPCGRNSWSGGSRSRMVTGSPSSPRKIPSKSSRWSGRSLASALARARSVVGEDHLAHGGDALLVEEHVLGAAEADALGAEGLRRSAASSGVSALARTFSVRVASAQRMSLANSTAFDATRSFVDQHLEDLRRARRRARHAITSPVDAVDRQPSPSS